MCYRITTELSTGSHEQPVGILTPNDFQTVGDTDYEVKVFDDSKSSSCQSEGSEATFSVCKGNSRASM